MSEFVLEAADYEKIMDFALMDPFAPDYNHKILSLLKSNFAGSLAAYTSWSKDNRLLSYDSIGFLADFIRQIHHIYVNDEIRTFVQRQYSSNAWSGIFYSQEADPFTISDSKTILFLHEYHIHYFAIMVLSMAPRVNIILCKTDEEGPFSLREKEILKRIYELLSHQLKLRLQYNAKKHAFEIINNYCSNKKTGLIITDEERNVLTYNRLALSLGPRNLNLNYIDGMVHYVFSLFKTDGDEAEWDENEQTILQNGRYFTMEVIHLVDEEDRQEKYYLITIRKKKRYDNKIDLAVSARYGLTDRETHIAEMIVAGYTNYDIADQLHISVHTVKIHVSNLFKKLGVHSRMEAIMKLTG